MMTTDPTETRQEPGPAGADPQLRIAALAGAGCLVTGLLAAGAAALLADPGAAYGALVGAVIAAAIFVTGALAVHVVARTMPAAALLVALLTYLSQVVLAFLVFWRLSDSGLLTDGTLDRTWIGGVLVLCTLLWMAVQIRVVTRARAPLYDLPEAGAR